MNPAYFVDSDGQKLVGAYRYALRFAPGRSPINALWSLTVYDRATSLLVANPLNRYLLNSTMLPQFKRDTDGGLTLLIQHQSPGEANEPNWLPAPQGEFFVSMRLYIPRTEALRAAWAQPPLTRVA